MIFTWTIWCHVSIRSWLCTLHESLATSSMVWFGWPSYSTIITNHMSKFIIQNFTRKEQTTILLTNKVGSTCQKQLWVDGTRKQEACFSELDQLPKNRTLFCTKSKSNIKNKKYKYTSIFSTLHIIIRYFRSKRLSTKEGDNYFLVEFSNCFPLFPVSGTVWKKPLKDILILKKT